MLLFSTFRGNISEEKKLRTMATDGGDGPMQKKPRMVSYPNFRPSGYDFSQEQAQGKERSNVGLFCLQSSVSLAVMCKVYCTFLLPPFFHRIIEFWWTASRE